MIRGYETVVQMWGLTKENKKVLIEVDDFSPYFYLVLDEKKKGKKKEIENLISSENSVQKVELTELKYYGKKLDVFKVTAQTPKQVPKLREALSRIEGVKQYLEADIRYSMRYLIDKNVYPCRWHEVEVEEKEEGNSDSKFQVNSVFSAKSDLKLIEDESLPDLRKFAFDIECYNPKGTPHADKDPIIIISVTTDNGNKQFIAKNGGDKELLESFVKFFKKYDPDVIITYNGNVFDWPYLEQRAKINNVKLDLGRNYAAPHSSVMGHVSVMGRANIDMFDLAKTLGDVKVRSLENVAEYLDVMKKSDRECIDHLEIADYWMDPKRRPKLLQYAINDAESTYGISEVMLPFAIQMSIITGLPLDQVMVASAGFRVEFYLMREAFKLGELVPNRSSRRHESYLGGFVLEPVPGLHKDVAVFDFSAMYPNLMIKNNLSPDTYVQPGESVEEEIEVVTAPEVGHQFRQKPEGFFTKVILNLLDARKQIEQKMKDYSKDSVDYKVFNERQRAVKILTNAVYGYTGWPVARWYLKPVAESTAAFGRMTIKKTMEIAKKSGLKVYYGDTDSVFISYEPDKITNFKEKIREEIGLEIKPDKIFNRVFFTEAKKRYCGILEDGTVDVTGFERIRGDWTDLAREVQDNVIKIILSEPEKDSVEKALKYIRTVTDELEKEKIPYEKLIIWKTITQHIEKYKVTAAHVEAAKILEEHGEEIKPGTKIGYVIAKGSDIQAKRAKPHNLAKYEELDLNYYKQKQIIPAALRILSLFQVTEESILEKKKQASLDRFF